MSTGGMPPIDAAVKLPRGVVAASQRADDIHKVAYPTEQQPPTEPVQTPPAEAAPPPPAPPPPAPAPAPAPPAPPAAAAPAPPLPPPTQEDWQHRYTSLKGRFDTMASESANLRSRIGSLETMLSRLSQQPPATREPPQPQPQPAAKKRVTQKEIEEFSPELIDVIGRAALDAIEPVITQRVSTLKTEIDTNLKRVDGRVQLAEREGAQSAHQRLLDFMDRQVANWRVINKHPKFHNWLGLTDGFSGVTRKSLLDDAVKRGDSNRVLNFYTSFLAEQGDPAPATAQPLPPSAAGNQPPAANGNGRTTLESLAAPGRPAASGAAPQAPDNKEIITRAQISQFYANKRRNMYSKEEAERLEAELSKAINEGRIR